MQPFQGWENLGTALCTQGARFPRPWAKVSDPYGVRKLSQSGAGLIALVNQSRADAGQHVP
jgi:hypothetical protein